VPVRHDHRGEQQRKQDLRPPDVAARIPPYECAERTEQEKDRQGAVVAQERQVFRAERLEQRGERRHGLAGGLEPQRVGEEEGPVRHGYRAKRHRRDERGGADPDAPEELATGEEAEASQADEEESLVARRAEESGQDAQPDREAAPVPQIPRRARQCFDRRRGKPDRQEQMEDVLHPQQDHSGHGKRDHQSDERHGSQERRRGEARHGAVGHGQRRDDEGHVEDERCHVAHAEQPIGDAEDECPQQRRGRRGEMERSAAPEAAVGEVLGHGHVDVGVIDRVDEVALRPLHPGAQGGGEGHEEQSEWQEQRRAAHATPVRRVRPAREIDRRRAQRWLLHRSNRSRASRSLGA
jgi:hypothetical protein